MSHVNQDSKWFLGDRGERGDFGKPNPAGNGRDGVVDFKSDPGDYDPAPAGPTSNAVLSVNYRNLVDLIQRSSKAVTIASSDSEESDSSIEILSNAASGKRRAATDDDSDDLSRATSKVKKLRPTPAAFEFSLQLSLTAPPALDDDAKARSSFLSAIAAASPASYPVTLLSQKAKAGAQTGTLSIATPESPREAHSLSPLLELDPVDPANPTVASLLRSTRAAIAKQGKKKISLSYGEKSLLDSLVWLQKTQYLTLSSRIAFVVDGRGELFREMFKLFIEVELEEEFFEVAGAYLIPRRIVLEHLFPAPPAQGDAEMTVDFFYGCLERAPRTINGLPVMDKTRRKKKFLETEEECEARERRRKKGKAKARNQAPVDAETDDDDDYDELDAPNEQSEEDELLRPEGLKATLMPFQSRSVRWLLSREGKMAVRNPDADIVMAEPEAFADGDDLAYYGSEAVPPLVLKDVPENFKLDLARGPLWEAVEVETKDGGVNKRVWLNRVMALASLKDPAANDTRGQGQGLLSEEMGLGKTVEIISLILLHRESERNSLPSYYNPYLDADVQPCGLTLIIAPSAIVAQWQSEIRRHAPGLRVLRYENVRSVKESWTPAQVTAAYDVVLTTFDVLRREVVLARKPHERALRSGPGGRHRYRRSLFVQYEFLRVIMDEAQMMGNEMSSTSETASLIPRKYSFCVSGTPLKERIEDVQGLFRFLKIEPVGSSRAALARLLEQVPTFVRVWEQLGARTMKADVVHELELPVQHRMIVPVEFGPIENYYYESRYLEALDALNLESDGTLKNPDNFNGFDRAELNRWLIALRQLCSHPQIGQNNKRVLGNVLKTVDDVLTTMADGAVSAVHSEQRQRSAHLVRGAQLLMWDKESCERFEKALEVFQTAVADLQPVVDEIVASLRAAWTERNAERTRRGRSASVAAATDDNTLGGALALGLGDDEEKNLETPLSEKERAISTKLSGLRSRLRETLLVMHSAHFFSGSAYFNMGKFADAEEAAYNRAEEIRQSLLTPFELRVESTTVRLRAQLAEREEVEPLTLDDLEFPFSKVGGALLAQQVFEDIEITTDALNSQAELIWQWRDMIIKMMETKVSISGDDATGEEYAERAELQEKLGIYLEAYEALLADWRYALTGERSALTDALGADILEKEKATWAATTGTKRKRNAVNKGRKKRIDLSGRDPPTLERGDTPADILRWELLVERAGVQGERTLPRKPQRLVDAEESKKTKRKKKQEDDWGSEVDEEDEEEEDPHVIPIRTLISELKRVLDGDFNARDKEREILTMESTRLRKILSPKDKISDRLRSELGDITKAFNSRLTYFAQLQLISDEVADPDFLDKKWRGLPLEMTSCAEEAEKLEASILKKLSQRRYLESLQHDHDPEDNVCIICSDSHSVFVLTSCAHRFCQSCFSAWYTKSHSCAICKRHLARGDWETVKFKRAAPDATFGVTAGSRETDVDVTVEPFEAPVKLSMMPQAELDAVREIESAAPLSSKSDLIVKHVKYVRRADPTAKVVIFSAWNEALEILMQAFGRNGLGYVRLEGGGKKEAVVTKFVTDPNVAAFFLHTRSAAAGLNLVVARYVILVEPLLHPSLELQAVGRVHRIGQTQETQVLQFCVSNTVDERVAQLRGKQQSSLFMGSGTINTAKESRIMQGDVVKSPQKAKASQDVGEDEDDLAMALLSSEHFNNLQRSLLPPRLQQRRTTSPPTLSPAEMAGRAAAGRAAARDIGAE